MSLQAVGTDPPLDMALFMVAARSPETQVEVTVHVPSMSPPQEAKSLQVPAPLPPTLIVLLPPLPPAGVVLLPPWPPALVPVPPPTAPPPRRPPLELPPLPQAAITEANAHMQSAEFSFMPLIESPFRSARENEFAAPDREPAFDGFAPAASPDGAIRATGSAWYRPRDRCRRW